MQDELSDLFEMRYAAEGFMPSVAHGALTRMLELGSGLSPRRDAREAIALASLSNRISLCFEAAGEAEASGDEDSAGLEWTRALVLMNRLAERALGGSGSLACHQKSGRAG